MRLIRLAPIAPLVLTLFAAPALGERIEREYHETFDVEPGVTLRLDHGDGNVTIEPWDQDVIAVDVFIDIDFKRFGFGSDPNIEVEFDQRGNEVIVRENRTGSVTIGFHSYQEEDYTYTVKAPAYAMLALKGDDGNVEIEGWQAEIDVELEDGNLELFDVDASADLELSDGDVTVRGFRGSLVVNADDGDVYVSDSNLSEGRFDLEDGSLRISESSGNFEIEADDGDVEMRDVEAPRLEIVCEDGTVDLDLLATENVDWDIETDDGDIEVVFAQGISADFSIDTDEGRIRVDLIENDYTEREDHVSGTLADGAGKIRIRAADGDVMMREAD